MDFIKKEITSDNFEQSKKLFILGLESYQKELYEEAEHFFFLSLKLLPDRLSTLTNLSAVLIKLKKVEKANEIITKGINLYPTNETFYLNQGLLFELNQDWQNSLVSFNQAISIKPDYAEAYYNRGNTLQELKRFEEALSSYNQCISIKPDFVEALNNRGLVLHELRRFEDALSSYDQSISISPYFGEAYYNRGNSLQELKRLEEALVSYAQAISIKPDYAEAYNNRGNAFLELKRYDEVIACYEKALSIKPDYEDAYFNRGVVLQELNRLEESLVSYDHAISINPDYADAYYNRGDVLQELNRLQESLFSYEQAISIKPNYVEAYNNRGVVLKKLNRLDEAIFSYEQAICIQPNYVESYYNRGEALQGLNRLGEAIFSYEQAISIKHDFESAHWNLSLCNLLGGNFKNGWSGYEWRWKIKDVSKPEDRNFPKPLWLGVESIVGKSILLYAEQGLGDTIQFCRYVQLVSQLGAKVILEVQRPLVKLLERLEGVSIIVAKGDILPEFDYQCPLMSLPLAFRTELRTIPLPPQCINGDSEKILKWKTKLGKKNKPLVGLVWSGSAEHKNDHNRSLTLSQLLPNLPANVEYVCLQKEIRDIDKDLLVQHTEIKYFDDLLEDFVDTEVLCELMDIVISVDTSVAHLAGTIGKPTWVLLPFAPDWRWLLGQEDNPWYPSVKLFRQEKKDDWSNVLEKIKVELRKQINTIR